MEHAPDNKNIQQGFPVRTPQRLRSAAGAEAIARRQKKELESPEISSFF
jgi:hypothetical protein